MEGIIVESPSPFIQGDIIPNMERIVWCEKCRVKFRATSNHIYTHSSSDGCLYWVPCPLCHTIHRYGLLLDIPSLFVQEARQKSADIITGDLTLQEDIPMTIRCSSCHSQLSLRPHHLRYGRGLGLHFDCPVCHGQNISIKHFSIKTGHIFPFGFLLLVPKVKPSPKVRRKVRRRASASSSTSSSKSIPSPSPPPPIPVQDRCSCVIS